jgi:cobalamin biosynthesis Mg chelatase CobN
VSRRTLPILLVVGLSLGCAATPALAKRPLNPYEKMVVELVETQRLDACHYTTAELKQAKAMVPLDVQQYNAALIAAFDDAIAARAQGACNKKNSTQTTTPGTAQSPATGGTTGGTTPPQAATKATPQAQAQAQAQVGQPQAAQAPPTPQSEPTPAPAIVAGDEIALAAHTTDIVPDAPFPVLALAILLGVLALCTLAFGVVRFFAWEPQWAVRFRHAAGEAGWRASSTWADFADYVRLGR